MEKQSLKIVLIWAIGLSIFANVFFGRWITAKVSTLPLLNRLDLLNPQAPIVFKETREIRVSAEGEIGQTLEQIRRRVSQVGLVNNKQEFQILASAVNFTSDGLFVTSGLAIPSKFSDLKIRYSDGKITEVTGIFQDKPTGLVFLKTSFSGAAAAPLADSTKLQLGDRLLFFNDSAQGSKYFESQVNFLPISKDEPFGFQNNGVETRPGEVIANYKGEILAVWHEKLVVSEKIKTAFENYLKSLKK